MERFKQWILPTWAAILIAGAALTVLWLADVDPTGLLRPRSRMPHWPVSSERGPNHSTVYRFLLPSETQAVPGRLTLGRFVDGRPCEGATWTLASIDQWHDWAPSLFDSDEHWIARKQPGWRISRWLTESEGSTQNCDRLFWSIQALRCLDPESFVNEIDMIGRCGRTITIFATEGPSDYDYDTDTLYWNPVSADPLAALAHELNHVWHDLCRNGGTVGIRERESLALMAENRIRHILYLKDPTRSHIRPRYTNKEASSRVQGDSAQEAWWNYRDALRE